MSGPNCFLLKYDLIFTPCCSISTFMLLLHINMLQTLPASPHDLHICASLSISSTYRCFFLRLWLSYVFPLLKARFVLTQTFLDLQLYISSCSLSSLQRCSQSPQNPIFGNWVHYVYYLTKPPPPLAPPPPIHIPIIPRPARSSVKSYDVSLFSHSLLLHISKFNRSQRSCSFSHQNVLSISQTLYLCLPLLAPVISSALCLSGFQFIAHNSTELFL